MNKTISAFVCLLVASVSMTSASATTIIHTGPAGLAFTSIPKFDASLGTLTSVELSLVGGGDIFGDVINPDPFSIPAIPIAGFSGIDVIGFFGTVFDGSTVAIFPSSGALPPDPVFAPVGFFDVPLSGSGGILLTDSTSLSDFTATFPGDEYEFSFLELAPIVDAGGADVGFFDHSIGGDLSVTYTFTVVPEPTTFATSMLLSGLGATGGFTRRKRRISTRSQA